MNRDKIIQRINEINIVLQVIDYKDSPLRKELETLYLLLEYTN